MIILQDVHPVFIFRCFLVEKMRDKKLECMTYEPLPAMYFDQCGNIPVAQNAAVNVVTAAPGRSSRKPMISLADITLIADTMSDELAINL